MDALRSDAGSGKKMPANAGRPRKADSKPVIRHEERRRLIEVCAFFHALQFRSVEPGAYREQDLKDAAAEIDAVLKRSARKGGKA